MKKLSKIFVAVLMCMTSILILSACKAKIESGYIKSGTIATTIAKDEVLDTSNAVAILNYTDGTKKEVSNDELSFSTVDTSTIGTKSLTVTFGDFSFTVNIKVVATEADVNSIASLESQLLKDFQSNKKTQSNKQEEFYDLNQPLYVGDDNEFDFRIVASGVDGSGNLITDIQEVRTIITVEEKIGTSYVALTGSALNSVVAIDDINATLDFTQSAVGREFRVTVQAENRDEAYEESATKFSANLKVIDAYNVYNAKDLSVYDNYNQGWDEIKLEYFGTDEIAVKGIVLQNDINITKDDVREDLFWKTTTTNYNTVKDYTDQTLEGTPIDHSSTGIYHRVIEDGEEFNFIGNYFSVNLSDFPKMVVEATDTSADNTTGVHTVDSDEYMTAHLSVFYTMVNDSAAPTQETQVNWSNLFFIGNGELNADPINSGAIILMKNKRVNFHQYNTIIHNFYITNFIEKGEASSDYEGNYVIEKSKGYNSYQTLLYVWGAKNLTIIDSEYKNAGGPAMIVDHSGHDSNGDGGYPSHINIISSDIESKVSGKEPWFTVYGAGALVGQIASADQFYTGVDASGNPNGLADTGKTIVAGTAKDEQGNTVPQLNIIVAMKSGDAEGITNQRIHGYVRFFDSMTDYEKYYGLNGQTQEITTYGLDMDDDSLMNKAFGENVYFQSNGNGGYINQGFNGSSNLDSTLVEGTVKVTTMYTILTTANPEVASNVSKDAFDALSLEQQKSFVNGVISQISDGDTLTSLYQAGVSYGALSEIADFASMTVEEKQTALTSAVSAFENKSYADGNYINIYLYNGMGAVIGLYDAE